MGTRKYPKGWGKYSKLTKGWENYIFKKLYPKFLKEFPTTKGMTQLSVAKWLVEQDWIEEVQRYTYRAVVATGRKISFKEFQQELMRYETYDGKTINAWKNSYERAVARRMVHRMKTQTRILNQRLGKLGNTTDIAYIRELADTMVNPPKKFKRRIRKLETNRDGMTDAQYNRELNAIKSVIANDIEDDQYKELTKETFDKVNNYQGKRLSQDQLQRANNDVAETKMQEVEDSPREDIIMEGEWKLSPSHKKHYFKGGDPCEKHAKERYFYGEDIPVPVKDSHFGCKCSLTLKVIPVSKMKK